MSVAKLGELLCALEAMQGTRLRHINIGYESRFCPEYQHASQWSVSRDDVPQRVDPDIGTAKFMFTAIWGVNGFHLPDLMPSNVDSLHNISWDMLWCSWFRWSSHKG
jgi:hypothetical protein